MKTMAAIFKKKVITSCYLQHQCQCYHRITYTIVDKPKKKTVIALSVGFTDYILNVGSSLLILNHDSAYICDV